MIADEWTPFQCESYHNFYSKYMSVAVLFPIENWKMKIDFPFTVSQA